MARSGPVIVFRTEGDTQVGLGHVVRSLALARRLSPPARCVFIMGTRDDPVLDKVTAAGHEVACLRPGATPEEAAEAIARQTPQAAVIDLPGRADDRALRRAAPLLVVIDDLGLAERDADLVINGTLVQQFRDYPRGGETQFLLGPTYIILGDEFARCGAQPRGFPRVARTAVVSMGGADQRGLTPRVLEALGTVEAIERCLVVVGPMCGDAGAVRRAADASRLACRVVTDPPHMAPLLYGADLAVTCGGMTLYEAAAVGTPAIALPQVEPQMTEIEEFAQRGAALPVAGDLEPDLTDLAAAARGLAANLTQRKEMSRCARALVDGRGAQRVAVAILDLLAAPVR